MKMSTFTAAVFGTAVLLHGQPYSLSWFSVDSGGGISVGGGFTVNATIGQADAETVAGGSYTITGGFWSVIDAFETPQLSALHIARTNENVILFWEANGDFRLERTSDLTVATGWQTVTLPYMTNGGIISVTVPLAPGNTFFRLKKE